MGGGGGGGVVTFLLLYSSIAFTLCVCGGGGGGGEDSFLYYILVLQSFELTVQDSHPSLYSIKHCIICIFLIHSDSLQRTLSTLFKLVRNTEKSTRTIF